MGPSWLQLLASFPAWHAPTCFPESVGERLLKLANIDSKGLQPSEDNGPSATLIHQIIEQGDPAVALVRRQMAAAAGLPLTHSEPLFILEYRSGGVCSIGQAMPHHDWNCVGGSPDDPVDGAIGCPELRLVTSLAYINTVPDGSGGQTRLPRAGIEVQAKAGSCFLWFNAENVTSASQRGSMWRKMEKSQHQGVCIPPHSDIPAEARPRKFVAVQWIRASPTERMDMSMCDEDPGSCVANEALLRAVNEELTRSGASDDMKNEL